MFEVGSKVTVVRGKLKGAEVEILSPADPEGQYAIKVISTGLVAVSNAVNLKAPAEATIGEAKLAAEISTLVSDLYGYDADDRLQAFVSRLSGDMPGLGARVSWPAEDQNEIQR